MNGDLISREALKKAIMYKTGVAEETWEQLYDSVLEEIDNAPTVNPCDNCDLYFKAMTKEETKKGGAE